MTERQPQPTSDRSNSRFKWGIVVLILCILVLASFVFGRSTIREAVPTPSEEVVLEIEITETTAVSDQTTEVAVTDMPPSPKEVGYTDGIIFFATILVLILLVGTLREVVQRKGV